MQKEAGKKIGVLAIQGSVEEHLATLKKIGVTPFLVKTVDDLKGIKGLIMPGGESTTIGKLMRKSGLSKEILKRAKKGMPIYGTCAGAILMAKKIAGSHQADSLKLMTVEVMRNAYGRQKDSFQTKLKFDSEKIPAIFIRAPKILKIGKNVKILAKNGTDIVAAREGNLLITTFHPELTKSTKVHEYFLKMC